MSLDGGEQRRREAAESPDSLEVSRASGIWQLGHMEAVEVVRGR